MKWYVPYYVGQTITGPKFCLSVCAPFCPYNSKTVTPIKLKFGGQVFHGIQTDSSKFGLICFKIKARREFFLFLIGNTQ